MATDKLKVTIILESPRDGTEFDLRSLAWHMKDAFDRFAKPTHKMSISYDIVENKKSKKRGKK